MEESIFVERKIFFFEMVGSLKDSEVDRKRHREYFLGISFWDLLLWN